MTDFDGKKQVNDRGDNVLHYCAEYGRVEMFNWFKK